MLDMDAPSGAETSTQIALANDEQSSAVWQLATQTPSGGPPPKKESVGVSRQEPSFGQSLFRLQEAPSDGNAPASGKFPTLAQTHAPQSGGAP